MWLHTWIDDWLTKRMDESAVHPSGTVADAVAVAFAVVQSEEYRTMKVVP